MADNIIEFDCTREELKEELKRSILHQLEHDPEVIKAIVDMKVERLVEKHLKSIAYSLKFIKWTVYFGFIVLAAAVIPTNIIQLFYTH